MSRKPMQYSTDLPYHLNARCINREWFTMEMADVWEIMENQLYFLHHAFQVQIHCFVLMSNHFHLIATFPLGNISVAMAYFMRETSRSILKGSDRINQTWGGRFHRCLITSYLYYLNAYKYVYQNPLQAGLCKDVLEYPFSTLRGSVGLSPLYIPTIEDSLIFDNNLSRHLAWLNERPEAENFLAVQKALKKKEFELPKFRCKPHPLEINLL